MNFYRTGTFLELISDSIGGDWGEVQPNGNYKSKVTCIRGTDMPSLTLGSIVTAPVRYISRSSLQTKKIKANDLVVEISGGSPIQSTGRIALVPRDILEHKANDLICSNFCRILRVKPEYLHFFFQYWLFLYRNNRLFCYENSSTGLKNFDFSAFIVEEPIPIPPLAITKQFNALLEPIYADIFKIGFEIEALQNSQRLILPRIMHKGI